MKTGQEKCDSIVEGLFSLKKQVTITFPSLTFYQGQGKHQLAASWDFSQDEIAGINFSQAKDRTCLSILSTYRRQVCKLIK